MKTIIKDVFASLPYPPEPKALSARARTADIEQAIELQATERGLVAHKSWTEKCLQLYTVSTVCQGMCSRHSTTGQQPANSWPTAGQQLAYTWPAPGLHLPFTWPTPGQQLTCLFTVE